MNIKRCDKHDYQWDSDQFVNCPMCIKDEQTAGAVADVLARTIAADEITEINPEFVARFEEMMDEDVALHKLMRELTLQQRQAAARGRKLWKDIADTYNLDPNASPYYFDGKVIHKGVAPTGGLRA